jgi:hypothetical protein
MRAIRAGWQLLDDSMMTMSTITSSRFVQGIRAEVEKMETALHAFAKVPPNAPCA